ncbi:MAG TPA: ATP-dependent helicase [Anaerovoracaceae bacterium]|nr:ATP-dependent helicase [Anaerovoracaceae bacterium]
MSFTDTKWSKYQLDIFQDVAKGAGHTVVEALAGSGKTTTIVEALKYIPSNLKWLLVAFNKKIAEELKSRAPAGGEVSTLHSLGLKSIGATLKGISVDNDKLPNIIAKVVKDKERKEVRWQLQRAVSLAKGYLAKTSEEIDEIMDTHDVECVDMEREEFINHVIMIMDFCKMQTKLVDFDDMIWFPNVLQINVPKFDRVFVDEAQDLNKAQIALVLQAVQPAPKTKRSRAEGRVMVVGDKYQAIYGFRGADMNGIDNLRKTLKAKTLPLSVTYRCPLSVVKEAQKIVPGLEPAPNAPNGKVCHISIEDMKKEAKPGCFILSRTNAPLIGLAMHFIKNGIPANIQGRDIGENLLTMIRSSKAKSLDKFLDYVKKWQLKETARLTKYGRDITHITDKVECFFALAENISSLTELRQTIERLFADSNDYKKIILSTTHKAKGLERSTVYMLLGTYRYSTQEEHNLRYVAITRSQSNLFFVKAKTKEKDDESKSVK